MNFGTTRNFARVICFWPLVCREASLGPHKSKDKKDLTSKESFWETETNEELISCQTLSVLLLSTE